MVAHAVSHHGTAITMSELLISGAHNVYIGSIPELAAGAKPFGALLKQLQLSSRGGLPIGIRLPSGEVSINPPQDQSIEPGTLLVYLAEAPLLEPPA